MAEVFPQYDELPIREGALYPDAWGVFGAGDQLGTLNHLTESTVLEARQGIRSGQVVNLNLPLTFFNPPLIAHRGNPKHEIFGLNEYNRDDKIDGLFTQACTQIDGLRHFAHPDYGFYNGVSGDLLNTDHADLGMQNVASKGIVGRGVLIDVARYREQQGNPLSPMTNEPITVADIENTLSWQGAVVKPGDIVLIRTGWLTAYRQGLLHGSGPIQSVGLSQSEDIARWIWNSRLAVIAADNIALEAWPPQEDALPTLKEQSGRIETSSHTGMLHRLLIPLLGITIGELWDLDELSDCCAQSGYFDFFLTAEPLHLIGGVGSPANALAIL